MDTDSINSLLKYFPYTEAEKNQVRELLIRRDPALMQALNNFLTTKDVTALNREFKTILSQQGSVGGVRYVSSASAAPIKNEVVYSSPVITTTTYGGSSYSGGVSTGVNVSAASGQQLNVAGPSNLYTTTTLGTSVGGGDAGLRTSSKGLTESVKRAKVEADNNIKKLKRMSEYAKNRDLTQDLENDNVLKTFTFDFMPSEIKNNHIEADVKKKLIEMAGSLSFENFLDIRHFLRLDKIDLNAFIDKAKVRVEELHPLKAGQDRSTYNPGFSLEEFVVLLCGESETPKNKLGYIGLLFYYLDYNHNQILEIDEILQGFIMLGPGDKKDKISAAFRALRPETLCLNEIELAHYFEIVIRVYKLKEDMGNSDKSDLYDIQKAIDLAAKSLSRKIFELIDYDQTGHISLEEFLIWQDRMESKEDMFQLKNDPSFRKSLDLAKESKKKRVDNFFYSIDEETQISTKEKFKTDIVENHLHMKTIENLKKNLKVDQIDVGTAVNVFKTMNYSKALTVQEFHIFFQKMYAEEKVKFTPPEEANIKKEIVRLFQILDTNKNGVLEWDELMSAMIFVLRGSESEKARIAFQQFDTNGDGTLQFKEFFFFLKGIFNLLMYANQHDIFRKENFETIAFATAKECFKEFKLDVEKDAIDYKNFQKWYSSNL